MVSWFAVPGAYRSGGWWIAATRGIRNPVKCPYTYCSPGVGQGQIEKERGSMHASSPPPAVSVLFAYELYSVPRTAMLYAWFYPPNLRHGGGVFENSFPLNSKTCRVLRNVGLPAKSCCGRSLRIRALQRSSYGHAPRMV